MSRGGTIGVSIGSGIALELVIRSLSGRREAWDSGLYWTLGLPAVLLISVLLGLLARRRDWLWTFLIVPSQVTTMMVMNGELGGLWPLTAGLSAILSAPFVGAAFIGSRLRRRTE